MRIFFLFMLLMLSAFLSKAQLFGSKWEEGAYYDMDGKKTSGLLANYTNTHTLNFKTGNNAEEIKIQLTNIRSIIFKISKTEIDSFVVSHYSKLTGQLLQVVFDKPLKLYVKRNDYNIMNSSGLVYTNTVYKYYFGKDPDTLTELKKNNFIPTMSTIMSDRPDVVALIRNKRITLKRLPTLIEFLKTEFTVENSTK